MNLLINYLSNYIYPTPDILPLMPTGIPCAFISYIQVPPPSIDFVLPSPTIGLQTLPVIDPPWQPHFKSKVEEVTINQEQSVSASNWGCP